MKVLGKGPRAGFGLSVVLLASLFSTGCLVEKERNPGAKAAQRAAEQRRLLVEQAPAPAEAQVMKASGTLRAASGDRTILALVRPQDPPSAADQIVATLEPLLPTGFDCTRQIAKRIIDHSSGDTEIAGPILDVINGLQGAASRLPVLYRETFEIDAGEVKMEDLLPGEYRLQLDLINGQTSRIYQRGVSYITIIGGTKAEAKVEFQPIGVITPEDSSDHAGSESALKPYSELCPYGRTKNTIKLYRPQYVDSVVVSEG